MINHSVNVELLAVTVGGSIIDVDNTNKNESFYAGEMVYWRSTGPGPWDGYITKDKTKGRFVGVVLSNAPLGSPLIRIRCIPTFDDYEVSENYNPDQLEFDF